MKTGTATVVKHTGSHYLLTELPRWELFPAVLRGKIRLSGDSSTNPVAVGDRVTYETDGGTAVITGILPRKNHVIRRPANLSRQRHVIAANVDMAFIVFTLDFPEVKLPFLDRLLVTCEVYRVPATIVLNKCDLYGEAYADRLRAFRDIYENAGYRIIEVSALTGEGIGELRTMVAGTGGAEPAVSLFSGVSGVGKSSLIKALDPSLEPRTGDISEAHLQGKHTTTFYEMYRLASGGFIIDTPGIRGFGLVDLERDEIALYFPEMLKAAQNCKFAPCTHTHEPGCAVKKAVEDGEISSERYFSYLGMLDEDGKYRQ